MMELKKPVQFCQHKSIWNRPQAPRFNNIKCTNFLLFYVFYHNLKEKDHTKRIINSKKRNVYIGN